MKRVLKVPIHNVNAIGVGVHFDGVGVHLRDPSTLSTQKDNARTQGAPRPRGPAPSGSYSGLLWA